MLDELINASQALLQAEKVLDVLEYSSDQNEYDRQYNYVEMAKKGYYAIARHMFPELNYSDTKYYDMIHDQISELSRQYDTLSIEDISIYDADELYSYCVDAGIFDDNEYLESAIAWIPRNNLIEWYTLNVFTEYNGLDLTRLGANHLMMIHYSK